MSLYEYIQEFAKAIASQKLKKLRNLLTINPGPEEGALRASFQDPSDVDLYLFPDKFKAVLQSYLQLMKSIYVAADINRSFHDHLDLMVHLNRAAETQTNWICPTLINCSNELISIYQVRAKLYPDEEGDSDDLEKPTTNSLELVANTINRSFKICLTDKNSDMTQSKKSSIHFFLATLIKIYFKLDRLELAKSMEKALMGTGLAIPTIVHSPVEYRKHIVTYLYYSALLSLDEGDYAFAETKLLTAMEFLSCYKLQKKVTAQAEKILFLLVPLKLHNSRSVLPLEVWDRYTSLRYVYKDQLFDAIYTGNLRKFDECINKFQALFLKRHIFILVLNLKSLCYLRLIKRTASICGEMNTQTPHILAFSGLQLALEFSKGNKYESNGYGVPESVANGEYSTSYEELECIMANLIAKRLIKGYLSHGNRCVVFLKTNAFPLTLEI
ncbi:CIC11C00000002135 [Sungouiella intermedia]|uniref:CIC11C00000002135 n=1 Tax=Sungouiella intermedia TaxID=45354 RepID=A0A1L0BWH7_9ASCO|nr:CIC11C00000002135 [[Candida] intermedia]